MTERAELADATTMRLFGVRLKSDTEAASASEGPEPSQVFAEHAFADSWTREGLDDRTRSLMTIAILATMGISDELRLHVHGALTLGVTPEEIADTCVHVGVYAGVPRGGNAWSTAKSVIAARAAK